MSSNTGAYLGTGMSPLVQSYFEWQSGRSSGAALPRDWQEYLSGGFSPLEPIYPVSIDQPDATGHVPPRRWEYQPGWNMPMGQPGSEGLKLAPFSTLRAIADMYSVARACVQVRKEEILGLDWDIVPTTMAEKGMELDLDAHADYQGRRTQLIKFFNQPDRDYPDYQSWLSVILEEIFVTDAVCLYLAPPRVEGKGKFGSNLAEIQVLDGTLIRPMVDIHGATPRPPNPAYQCYDDRTEVLTRNGWVSFADLRDEEIATRSPDGEFQWQRPTAYTAEAFQGDMIHFYGKGIDVVVTPNHRMLYSYKMHDDWVERIDTAEHLADLTPGHRRLIATSWWRGTELPEWTTPTPIARDHGPKCRDITMSGDDYMAFMGMYLSEGSAGLYNHNHGRDKDYRVSISQSDKGKGYIEFGELLERILGRKPQRNGMNWVIHSRSLTEYLLQFGHSHEKFIPPEVLNASSRQIEIFLHYYYLGDGTTAWNQRVIYTASSRMADQLQECFQKIGTWTRVRRRETLGHPGYIVAERKTNAIGCNVERIHYQGKVYCVSVPNGIVYIRRNGYPIWCGNSYLFGVPRVDLLTAWIGEDLEDLGPPDFEFAASQIMYLPYVRRRWTPYGFSSTERGLVPIASGMARQKSQLDWFCYSDDTEILTDEGWKAFPALRGDENVATRSEDGIFEWQQPVSGLLEFDYDGPMMAFENRVVDALVTPNHRMIVRENHNHDGKWRAKEARSFLEGSGHNTYHQVPTSSTWYGSGPSKFVLEPGWHGATGFDCEMEDFCRFLGLYVAEGWYRKDRKDIFIAQMETSRHLDEIAHILAATGLHWA